MYLLGWATVYFQAMTGHLALSDPISNFLTGLVSVTQYTWGQRHACNLFLSTAFAWFPMPGKSSCIFSLLHYFWGLRTCVHISGTVRLESMIVNGSRLSPPPPFSSKKKKDTLLGKRGLSPQLNCLLRELWKVYILNIIFKGWYREKAWVLVIHHQHVLLDELGQANMLSICILLLS